MEDLASAIEDTNIPDEEINNRFKDMELSKTVKFHALRTLDCTV